MVTDTGGIDDRSFNASAYQGLTDAKVADPNITVKYLQSTTQSDYVPNINALIQQKCGIIVTVGFLMGDATQAAAKANPTQNFAIVDYNYTPVLANVKGLLFNTAQAAYLGGYLAAGMTKTGTVATFGGVKIPPVTIYMDGFVEGVAAYNAKHSTTVKVLGWDEKAQNGTFTGDFTDQSKGKNLPGGRQRGFGGGRSRPAERQWRPHALGRHGRLRQRPVVLQPVHLERREGHCGRGQAGRHRRRQRHLQGRQLRRHAGQQRHRPGAVPQLRLLGARLVEVGARPGEGGHHQRQDHHRLDRPAHQLAPPRAARSAPRET
jgi:hypothetical protein